MWNSPLLTFDIDSVSFYRIAIRFLFRILSFFDVTSLQNVVRSRTPQIWRRDIGFLLYLPANLESGATVQAYIETNTTEPFTAELNFIHSNEDRHFYSSARIENGEGSIDIEVPKVDYWYGSVNFTGVFEVSQKTITGSRNNIYIYRDVQKATFIETDKPLYKPGQEVKFRLITIDSDFKPETSNISKIQIESPNNIRLAQWRNVERPDGLVDLSFQLISEPALGIYNIKAYVDDNWISQPFKVDEYVLPKFEVTVRADSYILINAEEFSFQVCAKYTYGQPVRGSLAGSVGKVVKENYYYYYRQRESTQLGEDQDELELTDAVEFIAELDNQGCYETTIDVTEMNLSSYDTPYWKTSLAVKATITEASTGNEFTETYAGTKLETNALHINMESASTFKPGIPYQGRIKVTYPDDKPAPNEVLNITARVDGETVHQDEATTDSDGIVNFEIPFAVMDKSIRLTVTAVGYPSEHSEDSYSMYQPSSYINLDPAYSNIGRYMQILPVTETVNAGEDVTVQVLYTSDDSTVSSDFKFQFVARNKLIDAGATHIGESRRRRVAILDETECQQQLREATEKGALGSFRPDCDENGLFMKRQCHASTRRCWCVNPETGLEVTSGVTPDCEAEEESGPIEVPIGELGPPDAFNECQEGFSFAPGVKKCVRTAEETECQRQAREAQEKGPLLGGRQPACHEDGSFLPEQCHGSIGNCWCVDTATGLEVPETRTGPTEENVDCEGTAEETECQRQAREAQEKGPLLGGRQPACHEDGSFLPEQCHGSIGYCWCVDTATGLEVPETRTGPTEENVDCEEPVEVLTECQRQVQEAQGKGPLVGGHQPACHEDGSFLPEQCHGSTGYCWCVDTATGLEVPGTSTGPSEKNVDCEEFTLTLTLPPPTTQEPIVHVDPQALQEATFLVRITPGLSPEARLLVYYTSPEGEIIADSVTIKVNEAFENEVHLEFSEPEVEPGSETTLKVSAENGSLCGIGIVDKSVYVLGGENKLTPKKLFAVFDLSVRTAYYGDYCSHGYYRYRFKRYILPYPGYGYNTVTYTDSSEAFKNSGLMTVTNFDLEVAPCTYSPAIAYSVARAGGEDLFDSPEGNGGPAKQDGEDTIRSYFPSTWLWTLQRVSETPAEMQLPVPDTITDWIANGFCTNVKYGVGIAPPVTLRAFQPFFLSMSLPYSIIRTEKTPIKVSVFNYLEQCLVVRVTLEENEDVVLSGDSMYTVAVPAGDVTTVTFKVAAFVLGEIPLQVTAESISDDEFLCGNEAVAGAAGTSDTVLRNLKVKPEGEPETRTESVYFCLENNETYNKHVSLKIPPQHVPGTAVGEITVTGDLVGNSLSNVEDMLRMPYGCGEQNLLSMVPNIVALQYLQSVGEATPEITEEAKKNILSGYQRELIYRRTDNSYSAFGNSNPSGSTFLTAFVVRTYAHAQKFVEVDEEDLFVTIQWLRGIQEVDGSFRTVGYLAHKAMKGGVNNNVTLAAYVVSTFLEAGYGTEDKTVAAAFKYLNSQLDSLEDTYSMALLAYAYALAGMEEFDQVYEKLQESAINSEGTRHWESNREGLPSYTSYYQDSAKSQNIEMTAYVLRAMILYDIPDIEVEGSYIARWLVAQRNPRGGFSSTQDTVIGLTALAEFSSMGSGSPEITLTMNIRGGETLEYEV
ncbi:putative pregnancy zone protein, partial [Apostichopus japonicus]